MKLFYLGFILIFINSYMARAQSPETIIKQKMQNQQECWNRGDLNCFMVGYWESDSLMFIGKDSVYYGYDNTLKRYLSAYPNREAMGTLTFEFIRMMPLGHSQFYLIGAYHLKRSIGDLSGHFTLLWQKIKGDWVIVADHSS